MATPSRRVGAETSKTRDTLLDCVEKMMLDEGYASVTYRALATKAGVTPASCSTTSPASTTCSSPRSAGTPNATSEDPLRALWEYSWDKATGTLMTEFMALSNHRKTIRTEIAAVTESVRELQLDALAASEKTPGRGVTCPCRHCSC